MASSNSIPLTTSPSIRFHKINQWGSLTVRAKDVTPHCRIAIPIFQWKIPIYKQMIFELLEILLIVPLPAPERIPCPAKYVFKTKTLSMIYMDVHIFHLLIYSCRILKKIYAYIYIVCVQNRSQPLTCITQHRP